MKYIRVKKGEGLDSRLTEHKTYLVLGENEHYYRVYTDIGPAGWYSIDRFEIVKSVCYEAY